MILFVLRAIAEAVFGRLLVRPERPRVVGRLPGGVAVPDFRPASRGAAFHTFFSNSLAPRVAYDERERAGEAVIDWAHAASPRGVVVVFHGIAGSSDSPGVRRLVLEVLRRGFSAAVFNRRGHARGQGLVGEFPDHANDEDTASVIEKVRARGIPVYAVGISAGANAMVRFIGSSGSSGAITAGVSVCGPLDLVKCYARLPRRLDAMLASWVAGVYARHRPAVRARSMREFEEFVTGRGLEEYYADQGSADALARAGVPVLCIGADNDPIVHRCILDAHDEAARSNPNVVSVRTSEGGHCGWIDRAGSWGDRFALDFIEAFANSPAGANAIGP